MTVFWGPQLGCPVTAAQEQPSSSCLVIDSLAAVDVLDNVPDHLLVVYDGFGGLVLINVKSSYCYVLNFLI